MLSALFTLLIVTAAIAQITGVVFQIIDRRK